ncbi:hypothetical protein [Flagellimonas sp. S3867]|uniref:hypothetical protein n=1 Tax=Flagellimonas sp. S3867 TaxID=2768063 RepID=UPI001685D1A6|nr:hypothetical protein [Flagellimonas sp. S3867]
MKNILLSFTIVFAIHTNAQRMNGEKLEFNYIQYPTLKLDLSWTYTPKVVQKNLASILEQEKAFVEKLERIHSEYQAEIERYENYSAAEKLISGKPIKPTLPEPIYTGEVLDEAVMANEYIHIDGFEKKMDNPDFTAAIFLNGFEYEGKFEKNKENAVFFYDIMYKNPVSVNVYDKDGKIHLNEVVDNTTHNMETPKKDSSAELKSYWKSNEQVVLQDLEKNSYKSALAYGADFINDALGYQEKSEQLRFNSAKGKKVAYPKLDQAIEIMRRALVNFGDGSNQNNLDRISEAVKIWEDALLKKNLKDKKALINKKVASGIYWNCVLAYSILNDFENAENHLIELKLYGRGASGTNAEKFMKKFQSRQRL